MMKYSERCHYGYDTEQRTHFYPCSLEREHGGPHRDGYGMPHNPEKDWYKRVDNEEQFHELVDRIKVAGMMELLNGLEGC